MLLRFSSNSRGAATSRESCVSPPPFPAYSRSSGSISLPRNYSGLRSAFFRHSFSPPAFGTSIFHASHSAPSWHRFSLHGRSIFSSKGSIYWSAAYRFDVRHPSIFLEVFSSAWECIHISPTAFPRRWSCLFWRFTGVWRNKDVGRQDFFVPQPVLCFLRSSCSFHSASISILTQEAFSVTQGGWHYEIGEIRLGISRVVRYTRSPCSISRAMTIFGTTSQDGRSSLGQWASCFCSASFDRAA
jgi:hypothetical protein